MNEATYMSYTGLCQMVYFKTKNPNSGIFSRAFEWKMFVYFPANMYNYWPFGIMYGRLGNFVVPLFWCARKTKNLATLVIYRNGSTVVSYFLSNPYSSYLIVPNDSFFSRGCKSNQCHLVWWYSEWPEGAVFYLLGYSFIMGVNMKIKEIAKMFALFFPWSKLCFSFD
jgi:hypothetical protein